MSTSVTLHIKVGDRVETKDNYRGTCQYVGPVKGLNSIGVFVGIELDEFIQHGHDGSCDDIQYFNCNNGHGIFITIEECIKIDNYADNYAHNYNEQQQLINESKMDNNTSELLNEEEEEEEEEEEQHIECKEQLKEEEEEEEEEDNKTNIDIISSNSNSNSNINCSELDTEQASASLNRKFKRRKSQLEIERQGIVPPNYFSDPFSTTNSVNYGHEMVTSSLSEWLPMRPQQEQLESLNIVPPNYFEDPIASTKGKSLVKQMISSNLEEFHHRRPTLDELQMKNIYHSAQMTQQRHEERQEIEKELNDKLSHNKRPTITDLGDMHIIPHDYLDNLLEDAVANHTRKQSRMDHVQDRLQKHLPQPVAATLAETLVTSVHDDDDDDDEQMISNNVANDNDNDEEWQISFVYEPMQSFVPMNPAQKDEVTNKLERRLSLRPSKQQIEVWGFVPPQYFESPEQSFLRQALGREIALDLLEGFFPNRSDIYNLTNRGIMHPDFIGLDAVEAQQQQHERKKSVMDELNNKLDPHKRPSIIELSDKGLIPENWLLDLYGLADKVRKRHKKMDSAVIDLKSQLNVPPILAGVVARDVLDEIETVDPYLDDNNNIDDDDDDDDDHIDDDDDDDDDDDNNKYTQLTKELNEQNTVINSLSHKNQELQSEINRMKEIENRHINKILSLEKKTSLIQDQTIEINRLREEQNSTELHRLDSKAIEIELSKERSNTQRLRNDKSELENKLLNANYKLNQMENLIQEFANEKIQLVKKTNEQINQLRNYIKQYQKYFNSIQQKKQHKQTKQSQNNSIFNNIFG